MSRTRHDRSSTDRPTAPSPGTQALERGLALLEILRGAPGGLALADLAAASGLHKSTVHRLVAALSRWGYVSRSPDGGRYRLGIRLAELGQVALQALDLRAEAAPHLRELVARTGITAHLGVLHGTEIVYLDKVESDTATVRMAATIGGRMPVHSTAIGKAILAHLPEDDVRALLARTGLPARTPRTITDMEVLIDQLRLVRRSGWALDDTENEEGIRAQPPERAVAGRHAGGSEGNGGVTPMTADDLSRLMAYRLWARGRVLASLEVLPAQTFTAPAVSSFPSIRDTLVHILSADMIWVSRLGGVSPDAHLQPGDHPDLASLQARWEVVDRALRAAVEGPPPADPGRVVTYRTTAGVEYRQPLGQIVQHLVNHQTYHLGQVATLVRQFGGRPPTIDLAVFDREGGAG